MEISFGNNSLRGVFYEGSSHPEVGIILLHPHPLYGGDMDNRVILLLERLLSKFGLSTMKFNFRGAASSSDRYEGPRGALEDSRAAINYLRDEHNKRIIGVLGYSFGGSIGLALSTSNPVDFLVTLSASLEIFTQTGLLEQSLQNIECPTLMFHGRNDRMVPFSDIKELQALIGRNARAISLDDEGHFYNSKIEDVLIIIDEFLQSMIEI